MADIPGGINMHGVVDLSAFAAKAKKARQAAGGVASANGVGAPGETGASSGSGQAAGVVVALTSANFEAVLQFSTVVPVVVLISRSEVTGADQLEHELRSAVSAQDVAGHILLALVDADHDPQVAAAFQPQQVPMVVAVLGGRPAPLFSGVPPTGQISDAIGQVMSVAAQGGLSGHVSPSEVPGAEVSGAEAPGAETPGANGGSAQSTQSAPVAPTAQEPKQTPTQQLAYDAMERGDYETAVASFKQAIAENPNDEESAIALTHAEILARLSTPLPDSASDTDSIMRSADEAFVAGDGGKAVSLLLDRLGAVFGDERESLRKRVVDYFELLGTADPVVVAARPRLASLLY